ncbi:MAG: prepilin-type N-terminal cleavage/methylation domain-containing protein [Candidatus Margulisbacteria bacterium]|nr:prepilin-type N-terminal cleavage/methylation domain-containing protein [Candidatus Margulisiibacteriota bacterium]MBU1021725.1 prepilin-type N-terminal cleavage/methylation domain-containing protein [Candidatus Margulisiibacteriota bacterium]MBU1729471.1 prepilin-type N-terminal cleavage/methylation domain-containing protein [Candidatus Margulisiibacteriota bacterium]MBU1955428.1 prepilin-type N-terminal cleavage/methylation domain-containing protein [Candidatus Margulisiibacteriota bacteriu
MKKKNGFTLLEVLFAIVLLLLITGFLLPSLGLVSRIKGRAEGKFKRIQESANVMEGVLTASFEGLSVFDGYSFFEGAGKVKISDVSSTLKKIVVVIGEGGAAETKLETLAVKQ